MNYNSTRKTRALIKCPNYHYLLVLFVESALLLSFGAPSHAQDAPDCYDKATSISGTELISTTLACDNPVSEYLFDQEVSTSTNDTAHGAEPRFDLDPDGNSYPYATKVRFRAHGGGSVAIDARITCCRF